MTCGCRPTAGYRWLWILATAVPMLWVLGDMALHFDGGLRDAQNLLDEGLRERADCDYLIEEARRNRRRLGRNTRAVCDYVYDKPLPVPWKHAVHVVGESIWDSTGGVGMRILEGLMWLIAVFLGVCLFVTWMTGRVPFVYALLWPRARRPADPTADTAPPRPHAKTAPPAQPFGAAAAEQPGSQQQYYQHPSVVPDQVHRLARQRRQRAKDRDRLQAHWNGMLP